MERFGTVFRLAIKAGLQLGNWKLCVGPVLLRSLDYGLTLYGQPPAYWNGDYFRAIEGSDLLRWCLVRSPLLFVAAGIVINVLSCLLLLCFQRPSAQLLAVFMMCAHIYGVVTWVMVSPMLGVPAFLALLYLCLALIQDMDEEPCASVAV